MWFAIAVWRTSPLYSTADFKACLASSTSSKKTTAENGLFLPRTSVTRMLWTGNADFMYWWNFQNFSKRSFFWGYCRFDNGSSFNYYIRRRHMEHFSRWGQNFRRGWWRRDFRCHTLRRWAKVKDCALFSAAVGSLTEAIYPLWRMDCLSAVSDDGDSNCCFSIYNYKRRHESASCVWLICCCRQRIIVLCIRFQCFPIFEIPMDSLYSQVKSKWKTKNTEYISFGYTPSINQRDQFSRYFTAHKVPTIFWKLA